MSKKHEKKKHHDSRPNNGGNNNVVRIPDDVKDFAKAEFKKFKKKNKDYYDSKKELKQAYYGLLVDLLPETISFVIRNGHLKEVEEIKNQIFTKLVDQDFVKYLKKAMKGDDEIENIKLFPVIIREISETAAKVNITRQANNEELVDISDLIELSQVILKKKIKKLSEKAGIDEVLALDVLSVIPNAKILEYSQNYRVGALFSALYDAAKVKEIPFANIVENLFKEEQYPMIIVFALLERKEKYGQLSDSQKNFYMAVSNWTFNTMEKRMDDESLSNILNSYERIRRRDESRGKDGNRRYALSTLSETDYPRITSLVKARVSQDETRRKFY